MEEQIFNDVTYLLQPQKNMWSTRENIEVVEPYGLELKTHRRRGGVHGDVHLSLPSKTAYASLFAVGVLSDECFPTTHREQEGRLKKWVVKRYPV